MTEDEEAGKTTTGSNGGDSSSTGQPDPSLTDKNNTDPPTPQSEPEGQPRRENNEPEKPDNQDTKTPPPGEGQEPEKTPGIPGDPGTPKDEEKPKEESGGRHVYGVDNYGNKGAVATGPNAKVDQTNIHIQNLIVNPKTGEEGEGTGAADRRPPRYDDLPLTELEGAYRAKAEKVFVPPCEFDLSKLLLNSDGKPNRVFLIHGEEHSGKHICAVMLGLELLKNLEEKHIFFYRRQSSENRPLIDFVTHKKIEKNRVYIISHAIESGISPEDLSQHYLPAISAALEKQDNFLILTTTHSPDAFNLPRFQAATDRDQQETVFEKHLAWYKDLYAKRLPAEWISQIDQRRAEILLEFTTPYQINRFFEQLAYPDFQAGLQKSRDSQKEDLTPEREAELLQKAFQQLATRVVHPFGGTSISPRLWFTGLSENGRLFALLALLFNGIKRQTLDAIYIRAVRGLIESGIKNLYDSRQSGRDDLLDEIHARVSEDSTIQFDNSAYADEVSQQVDNRHYLLWSLVESWTDIVKEYQDSDFQELRRRIGAAIGRLGIYYPYKLKPVLTGLAQHASGVVVAVAGYALEEVCRLDKANYAYALEVIDDWAGRGDPDLTFAGADSIWRVFEMISRNPEQPKKAAETQIQIWRIVQKLYEKHDRFNEESRNRAIISVVAQHLTKEQFEQWVLQNKQLRIDKKFEAEYNQIIERWTQTNLMGLLIAVQNMANIQPEPVVQQLRKWLKQSNDSKIFGFALLSTWYLFADSIEEQTSLIEKRHLPLLKLLRPYFQANASVILETIRVLGEWAQRTAWLPQISQAIASLANRLDADRLDVIIFSLAGNWMDCPKPEVRAAGRELITRLYIFKGDLLAPADLGIGLMAVDASRSGKLKNIALAGHQLACRMEARLNSYVFRMGKSGRDAGPGETVLSEKLSQREDAPRLIVPNLEASDSQAERILLLVALSWESVLDAADLSDEMQQQALIQVTHTAKPKDEISNWIEIKDAFLNQSEMLVLENQVNELLARQIGRLGEAVLRPVAAEMLGDLQDSTQVAAALEGLALRLAVVDANERLSPLQIRQLSGCVLWFAQADLAACVALLQTWLKKQSEEFLNSFAKACGRLLFNFFGAQDPAPTFERCGLLLDLVVKINEKPKSLGSVFAVLNAFEHWLASPEWQAAIFGGPRPAAPVIHVVDWLAKLVQGMPRENMGELRALVTRWSKPIPENASPAEKNHLEALKQAAIRLETYIGLGQEGRLPDLPENGKYIVLLVDASEKRDMDMTNLVSALVKKISAEDKLKTKASVLVGRIGQRSPIALHSQVPTPAEIVSSSLHSLPPLAGCFLEQIQPAQTAAIFTFSNASFLDLEDWQADWEKTPFYVYSTTSKNMVIPFYAERVTAQDKFDATVNKLFSLVLKSF